MKVYRRNPAYRVSFFTMAILFLLMSIPYFTTDQYLSAMGQVFVGLLWLIIFLVSKRSYVMLDGKKMIVYHNLIWPKEYLLSDLSIGQDLPKTIRFAINGKDAFFLYKRDFVEKDLGMVSGRHLFGADRLSTLIAK